MTPGENQLLWIPGRERTVIDPRLIFGVLQALLLVLMFGQAPAVPSGSDGTIGLPPSEHAGWSVEGPERAFRGEDDRVRFETREPRPAKPAGLAPASDVLPPDRVAAGEPLGTGAAPAAPPERTRRARGPPPA